MNIAQLYQVYLKSSGVCTDTRKLEKGHLYIALKGENFNGNEFAQSAMDQGAMAAIVDEASYANQDKHIYLVEDGLKFLQALAHHHRKTLKTPIIALTGSNGKTTTKELMANCLSQKFRIAYTKGNLNNHIGVPLTLLDINEKHDMAVVEMGANHQKEIAKLCAIAEPDYGYITNFGKAHLEGFGGFEGVIKGKSEMYDYLKENNKTAFINLDDKLQRTQATDIKKITFGFDSVADYSYKRNSQQGYAGIAYKNHLLKSHLSGQYNENNMAAAATIAMHFGVEIEKIQQALDAYIPKINRSQEIEKSGYYILLDAYNANPSSMEAALNNFNQKQGSKAVILGDMFELGKTSEQEHQYIADLATSLDIDTIYLIGANFYSVKESSKTHKFKTREDFISYIKNNPIKAKNLLIKGSRAMALENILDFI